MKRVEVGMNNQPCLEGDAWRFLLRLNISHHQRIKGYVGDRPSPSNDVVNEALDIIMAC